MSEKVEVHGLRELRGALNRVDKELGGELRDGLAEVAESVLTHAKRGVPVRSGRALGSMKVRKQSAGAAIAVGGSKAPYYPWLDFGGTVGRNKSVSRPYFPKGRYLYPALRDKRQEIERAVDRLVERLADKAEFDQSGHI